MVQCEIKAIAILCKETTDYNQSEPFKATPHGSEYYSKYKVKDSYLWGTETISMS